MKIQFWLNPASALAVIVKLHMTNVIHLLVHLLGHLLVHLLGHLLGHLLDNLLEHIHDHLFGHLLGHLLNDGFLLKGNSEGLESLPLHL